MSFRGHANSQRREAHADGLSAIPSKRFEHNRAFFQIALFSYNLWQHLKVFAMVESHTPLIEESNSRKNNEPGD
ncbi:MAG: hypothetical protein ONB46_18160 [candidate division KSB1 bacterium]|nr:hypothetical protein [candidate division KSB1 bacterium]MDZ7367776.1 hypothetical protein [candidate division KSB1 bacterium]MDZ7406633.1 hypothetical protein [candidate division KSB1 bacterium]